MTWHQWHAAYPTESRTALSSALARANASSPHGYQSTGLSACWRRYGLVACASRFIKTVWRFRAGRRGTGLLVESLASLRKAAADCKACPLWKNATQTVFGEGPRDAIVMLVG